MIVKRRFMMRRFHRFNRKITSFGRRGYSCWDLDNLDYYDEHWVSSIRNCCWKIGCADTKWLVLQNAPAWDTLNNDRFGPNISTWSLMLIISLHFIIYGLQLHGLVAVGESGKYWYNLKNLYDFISSSSIAPARRNSHHRCNARSVMLWSISRQALNNTLTTSRCALHFVCSSLILFIKVLISLPIDRVTSHSLSIWILIAWLCSDCDQLNLRRDSFMSRYGYTRLCWIIN